MKHPPPPPRASHLEPAEEAGGQQLQIPNNKVRAVVLRHFGVYFFVWKRAMAARHTGHGLEAGGPCLSKSHPPNFTVLRAPAGSTCRHSPGPCALRRGLSIGSHKAKWPRITRSYPGPPLPLGRGREGGGCGRDVLERLTTVGGGGGISHNGNIGRRGDLLTSQGGRPGDRTPSGPAGPLRSYLKW